jgi:hypothetical protein
MDINSDLELRYLTAVPHSALRGICGPYVIIDLSIIKANDEANLKE